MDLSSYHLPEKKKGGERGLIIQDLYNIYRKDDLSRKKENWRRYCAWCYSTGSKPTPVDPDKADKFKRIKFRESKCRFIETLDIKSFAIRLGHLKKLDLYHLKSVASDLNRTGKLASKFILGSVKVIHKKHFDKD